MEVVILIVLVVVLGLLYSMYLSLVGRKNAAMEALSGIDVQLQLRADAIPNVLKIARRFMEHESKLFSEITELRSAMGRAYDPRNPEQVQQHLQAATQLEGKFTQLLATAESYPELKSDQVMLQAQKTYNEVEAHIAAARRFYNSAVTDLNNLVEVFPANLLANMAGVRAMPFYRAAPTARAPIDADAYLA